jgi:hypothetical protein
VEPQPESDREACRVIVLGRDRESVLQRLHPTGFLLPSVEVPRWQRQAEHLTTALRRSFGCDALCLFTPKNLSSGIGSNGIHYEVMELIEDEGRASGTVWEPIRSLTEHSFQDKAEFRMIEACLKELDCHEQDPSSPFVKRGWFAELRNWAAKIICPLGLELTGRFRQYNASHSFSLIRFETSGPAVWFKAVGEPNRREFPITLKLTELFPTFTSEILGAKPEWNGWLSREAVGTSLGDTKQIALWERAARDLARLQLESIPSSEAIFDSGAHDLRPAALMASVDPFFDLLAQLMDEQTKIPPPALSRQELSLLKLRIQDSLALLEELRILNTLGHLDLNPWNIIVLADRSVFIDWAEAYVGHPFFSSQYFLEQFRRTDFASAELESRLMEAYKEPWQNVLSAELVDEALTLAPLAAVFACAAGAGAWRDRRRLQDQSLGGYFRSLARRMNREAVQLIHRRSPWPR